MYRPKQTEVSLKLRSKVIYKEYEPPRGLKEVCFYSWELKTKTRLDKDFLYLILPDVCVDIIFNLKAKSDKDQFFIMPSGNFVEEVNLEKQFHYLGIRFLPGVIQDSLISPRNLEDTWRSLDHSSSETKAVEVLWDLTFSLLRQNQINKNYLMHDILSKSEELHTVGDLEKISGYSRRQLQRLFYAQTGFSPSQFLRILRFQQTLKGESSYFDQSHLIKEYKRITGLTPRNFKIKY